jgi:hypothetical protein
MRLAMTAHHSGDAKLLEQFDLGQCSIPVTAGKSYTVATWYKSTTSTQFSIYYRIPSGRWKYWASSPFYQPAGQWTHAAWQAPPLPAGASGLSFGLTLSRAGVLTTDDYSIGLTQPSTGRRILDITLLALLSLGGAAAVARTLQRRRRRAVQEAADGQRPPEDARQSVPGPASPPGRTARGRPGEDPASQPVAQDGQAVPPRRLAPLDRSDVRRTLETSLTQEPGTGGPGCRRSTWTAGPT